MECAWVNAASTSRRVKGSQTAAGQMQCSDASSVAAKVLLDYRRA